MTKDELIEELGNLAIRFSEGWHEGIKIDASDIMLFNQIAEALAQPEQKPVAHWSDCAVHSEPAYPKGECDCGGIVAVADYTALSDKYVALSDKYVALKAQRTWVGLTDEEIAQGCKESWVTEQAWQSAVWWAEDKLKQKNGYAEENA